MVKESMPSFSNAILLRLHSKVGQKDKKKLEELRDSVRFLPTIFTQHSIVHQQQS